MTRWAAKGVFVCCVIFFSPFAFAGNDAKNVMHNAPAGARTDLSVTIPVGDADPETFIPVSVIKGESPGPTVLMVAGVHGYEFAPILAAQRLADEIDPKELSGAFVIVRVAHIPAFEGRSPYVNPYDRKNLNRSFPGNPDGTQTDRIAWALSSQIIPAADFVLDVHSGDGAEWLEAFVGVYGGPLASGYERAFNFAEAMGFPNIVRYQMKTQEQIDRGRSLNRQAVAEGLPTILVEIGQNGSRDPRHVEAIVSGIKRGLNGLGMLDVSREAKASPIRYFEGTQSVPVEHSGVWAPIASKGRFVESGEILGTTRDYEGRLVETVTAPISGYTIYGLAGPPVRAGESIATIARPSSRVELNAAASNN
ncbi:MAG: M14 family metallopeptidase [Pseudomonadota bacterium]